MGVGIFFGALWTMHFFLGAADLDGLRQYSICHQVLEHRNSDLSKFVDTRDFKQLAKWLQQTSLVEGGDHRVVAQLLLKRHSPMMSWFEKEQITTLLNGHGFQILSKFSTTRLEGEESFHFVGFVGETTKLPELLAELSPEHYLDVIGFGEGVTSSSYRAQILVPKLHSIGRSDVDLIAQLAGDPSQPIIINTVEDGQFFALLSLSSADDFFSGKPSDQILAASSWRVVVDSSQWSQSKSLIALNMMRLRIEQEDGWGFYIVGLGDFGAWQVHTRAELMQPVGIVVDQSLAHGLLACLDCEAKAREDKSFFEQQVAQLRAHVDQPLTSAQLEILVDRTLGAYFALRRSFKDISKLTGKNQIMLMLNYLVARIPDDNSDLLDDITGLGITKSAHASITSIGSTTKQAQLLYQALNLIKLRVLERGSEERAEALAKTEAHTKEGMENLLKALGINFKVSQMELLATEPVEEVVPEPESSQRPIDPEVLAQKDSLDEMALHIHEELKQLLEKFQGDAYVRGLLVAENSSLENLMKRIDTRGNLTSLEFKLSRISERVEAIKKQILITELSALEGDPNLIIPDRVYATAFTSEDSEELFAVTFSGNALKEMSKHGNITKARNLINAIPNGIVAAEKSAGVKLLKGFSTQAQGRLVEVKVMGVGGHVRLLGCLDGKNRTLKILVYDSNVPESRGYYIEKYSNLCD